MDFFKKSNTYGTTIIADFLSSDKQYWRKIKIITLKKLIKEKSVLLLWCFEFKYQLNITIVLYNIIPTLLYDILSQQK